MLGQAQHERKLSNDLNTETVCPEPPSAVLRTGFDFAQDRLVEGRTRKFSAAGERLEQPSAD